MAYRLLRVTFAPELHHEDWEDLAQEAVEKVIIALKKNPEPVDPSKGTFKNWFAGIVKNVKNDRQRREHGRPRGGDTGGATEYGEPRGDAPPKGGRAERIPLDLLSKEPEDKEANLTIESIAGALDLKRVFSELTHDEKEIVRLLYDGYSSREISNLLGNIQPGTVRWKLKKMRTRLNRRSGEDFQA